MPQMNPMNWMMIFMCLMVMILIVNSLFYFLIFNKKKLLNKNKKINKNIVLKW